MTGAHATRARASAPLAREPRSLPHPASLLFKASEIKVQRRRALAIHGYMGANGHGKTATMIRDSVPDILAGRPILSTVPVNDPRTGKLYDGFTLFEHWEQLHDHRGGPLLLDEVTGVLDAREDGMPQHIRVLLPQLRKRDVIVRYTAPDFDNADRRLRQISWGITVCRGYSPAPATRGPAIEAWRPNRLFSAVTFDTVTMTQLTEGYRKKAKVKIREWWWGPTEGVFELYDTMAAVSQVSSNCPRCGLPFQRRFHSEKTCEGVARSRMLSLDELVQRVATLPAQERAEVLAAILRQDTGEEVDPVTGEVLNPALVGAGE